MYKEELINNIFLIMEGISYPKKFNEKEYAIIYPTDGYYLFEEQFSSTRSSLKKIQSIKPDASKPELTT